MVVIRRLVVLLLLLHRGIEWCRLCSRTEGLLRRISCVANWIAAAPFTFMLVNAASARQAREGRMSRSKRSIAPAYSCTHGFQTDHSTAVPNRQTHTKA